jgi:hypothetical protein
MRNMRLLFVVACFSLFSCTEQKPGLLLVNESNIDRVDEPVTLAKNALVGLIGAIPEDKIPLPVTNDGDTIPFQLDDIDGDKSWDEMFFMLSCKPNSILKIYFTFIDKAAMPVFPGRSTVQFMKTVFPYEKIIMADRLKSSNTETSSTAFFMEGPVWENDRVAFRNYFDARNGMDIFGKKVNRMVFGDTSLVHQDYHQMQEWGMDILKVANSLGAGAIGLVLKGKPYRIDSAEKATYRLISDGPLRAVFQLDFKGWKADNRSYDILHQVSIWGGSYCYQSKVTVSGLHGDEELLTGIVNLHSDSLMLDKETESVVIAATHDKQGFLGEYLGMGILLNTDFYADTVTAPEGGEGINQTYMLKIRLTENIPSAFRFYSGWETRDMVFANREKFMDMLRLEAEKMASPLRIKGM